MSCFWGFWCSSLREVAALRLYRHLALFVADNLQHMHVEETENHATLIECYSEEDARDIGRALRKVEAAYLK